MLVNTPGLIEKQKRRTHPHGHTTPVLLPEAKAIFYTAAVLPAQAEAISDTAAALPAQAEAILYAAAVLPSQSEVISDTGSIVGAPVHVLYGRQTMRQTNQQNA